MKNSFRSCLFLLQIREATNNSAKQVRTASEEEKKRLERQVTEQMEALKKKQQEYSRLKAGWIEKWALESVASMSCPRKCVKASAKE